MFKRFLFTFLIVAAIVIAFSAIVTQKREERRALEARQKSLAERVANLNRENSELKKKNNALVIDPIQIEREAREKHGYIKPGEITYNKHKFSIREPKVEEIKHAGLLRSLDSFLFDGPFPWQVPLGLILIATIFLLISYKYERQGIHRQDSK